MSNVPDGLQMGSGVGYNELDYETPTNDLLLAQKRGHSLIYPGITYSQCQDIYSKWAPNYDNDMGMTVYTSPDELADHLGAKKTARILDCACGTGWVGKVLKQRGFTNIDALDANPTMLQEAKKKGAYTHMFNEVLGTGKLSLPDNTYDAIVTSCAIWDGHVNSDCFAEQIRMTKPGGVIVFDIPDYVLETSAHHKAHFTQTLKKYEDAGLWKQLVKKKMANVYDSAKGWLYKYEVLPKK